MNKKIDNRFNTNLLINDFLCITIAKLFETNTSILIFLSCDIVIFS